MINNTWMYKRRDCTAENYIVNNVVLSAKRQTQNNVCSYYIMNLLFFCLNNYLGTFGCISYLAIYVYRKMDFTLDPFDEFKRFMYVYLPQLHTILYLYKQLYKNSYN